MCRSMRVDTRGKGGSQNHEKCQKLKMSCLGRIYAYFWHVSFFTATFGCVAGLACEHPSLVSPTQGSDTGIPRCHLGAESHPSALGYVIPTRRVALLACVWRVVVCGVWCVGFRE